MRDRQVQAVITAHRQLEGNGFEVRRPFPSADLDLLDPFLLLDHLGPSYSGPGEGVGTPEHPHRGFETVTYLIEGQLEHRDSLGNGGLLGPGDTQWMTAGAGIVHQEGPSPEMQAAGGTTHGVQLWVNLAANDKMTAPTYQDIRATDVATDVRPGGVVVRVIAGQVFELVGPGRTHTPITYSHVTIPGGAEITTSTDPSHRAAVYVLVGHATVNGAAAIEGQLVVLGDGSDVTLRGLDASTDLLVLTGEPIGEPVVRYGPFVMNSKAEIITAIEDFQAGRMGGIAATTI